MQDLTDNMQFANPTLNAIYTLLKGEYPRTHITYISSIAELNDVPEIDTRHNIRVNLGLLDDYGMQSEHYVISEWLMVGIEASLRHMDIHAPHKAPLLEILYPELFD